MMDEERRAGLEASLAAARAAPYEVQFQARVDLALNLAELYLSADELPEARRLLDEEAAFAEKIFQAVQLAGTPEQKRAAARGRMQLRDRARQLALLGMEAPEISVKTWLQGEAATLDSLRGSVVLLEFWATWCKPCREMFSKLKRLDEEFNGRGLKILALTRHYMAKRGNAASEAEELELMRALIREQDVAFRVGVAEDERTQELYGATGLPTLALIDRAGLVRYICSGAPDPAFEEALSRSLEEEC